MSAVGYPRLILALAFSASSVISCDEVRSQVTEVANCKAVGELSTWLEQHPIDLEKVETLRGEQFASQPLSREDAVAATGMLWKARSELLRQERQAEMADREISIGEKTMPFWFKTFGEKPEGGRRLFISMHGGGNAPARVNDQQYENQKRLYKPEEGVYLVPRAPTNSWNLWHEAHIDEFFDRLITNMIIFEDVNPDRVYFMGYSAGGDGVYQLAPRMADRLAAASMMAGHPNETKPDSLRNIGFTIHMGAKDGAYRRNRIAGEWKVKLKELQEQDPEGYVHHVELHSGRSHWMNLEDAVAVPWMAKFERNRFPSKVVWLQDDVTHSRSYWLRLSDTKPKPRGRFVAEASGNNLSIVESDAEQLTLLLHDDFVDMDSAVVVKQADSVLLEEVPTRTIAAIAASLLERDDPAMVVYGELQIDVDATK